MSWYLKQHNDFIDGTQEFKESSNITIINNNGGGDSTDLGFNSTITDFLELKFEENVFNLYLKNTNPAGSIFLKNDNNDMKIKIEDGILYVYYDYNFLTSATIISGWTHVADYLVGLKQATFNNITAIAIEAANILTIYGTLGILEPLVASHSESIIGITLQLGTHEARLGIIESQTLIRHQLNRLDFEDVNTFIQNGLTTVRGNISRGMSDTSSLLFTELLKRGQQGSTQAILTYLRSLSRSRFQLAFTIGQNIFFGGAITGLIGLGYYAIDKLSRNLIEDDVNNSIKTLEYYKEDPKSQIQELLVVSGLQIDPTTNNDFLVSGTYEEIDTGNGGEITIKIDNNFSAIIISVEKGGTFAVNDVITISKSLLGGSGTGGNLIINVISVISFVEFLERQILEGTNKILDIDNRQRRRQLIPDKNDFNNGFSITETTELQESGEELPSIAIDLKLDTNQFEYDVSGNLQLINYSSIGEIGNPSSEGIPATGIFLTTETNTGNITTNTQGIADLETDFTNVYKVLMNTGIIYDNNTDYKLNIGYKEPFEGYAYNLICYALKTYTADVNNEFGNGRDFLGLYPVLTRLYDNTEIELLESSSLELRSDLSFKKGEITFKNTTTIDLNNPFELVINLKPRNLVADVEYDILISKELLGNNYTYDNNKLKIFIKNNKLNIRHKALATYQVGELRLGGNYFLNNFKFNYIIGINTNDSFFITDNLNYYYFTAIENRSGVNYGQDCGIKNNTGNYPIAETDLWTVITTEEGGDVPIYLEIAKPNNTTDTTIWDSPVLYYSAGNILTNGALSSKNFGGVRLRFTYEYWNLLTWINYTVPNQVILDGHNYKLQFGFSTNPNLASTLFLYRNFKTFGSYSGTTLGNYYEETFYFPELAPEITSTLYKKIEIKLVPLIDNTYPGPNSSQKYAGQIRLKLKDFRIYTYYNNALRTITNESIQTVTSTDDVFPVDYNPLQFNTLIANIDLPNAIANGIKFYVDDVEKTIPPLDTTITVIDNTSYPFTIEKIVNYNFNSITGNNNIFSIGGIPASGEMNYSHFNWKTNTVFLTSEERVKLQDLINYKYYHETVSIDRYLKVKEFYGDIVDFRRVLVNGTTAYESLTPEEQETRLRTSDQSTGNVLIGNSFLEIGKLFVDNPTISGNLVYDFDTRTFSIAQGASINNEDVENIIDGLIKTTPSTFGLIFNDTDVNDKYLQLDNTYINTLINLVLQNEVSYNTGFTNVKFNDILIQVKDASIYSPYNLRELIDVNTLYNYVVNGSHSYLIRELNQLVQYHPLLGPAFGDYLPTGSFNFNGILAEDQGNIAIDFEVVDIGAQITYSDGYNNNKLQNGLSGGLSYIQNINLFPFSDSLSGCISCFHKPYGAFTAVTIFEVTDVNENNLLRLRTSYSNGFARYILDVFDQTNATFTQYIFNNSENEVYYNNENSIVISYDFPNIYMYINGFKHDGSPINTVGNQTFQNARFKINASVYNDKSLLYELKVYDRKLFKDNDDIFNFKRVAEITEFYRINPISGSGLIIKELSGVQETKVRSIDNKRTISTIETYSDTKVRNILALSGGTNIVWNPTTKKFDCSITQFDQLSGTITYATISNPPDLSSFITFGDIPVQYSTSILETELANKAGASLDWNNTTKQFDVNIPAGTYALTNEIIPQVQSDFNETDTNSPAFIANIPNILTKITSTVGGNNIYQSDINHLFRNSSGETSFAVYNNKSARVFGSVLLSDGTTLTTAPVQSDWNETNGTSLKYIRNKPFIPPAPVQSDFNETDTNSLAFIVNKPIIPSAPVQSDFNETDTNSLAFIANLPNILTKIASSIGGNNTYQSDINHIFRNSAGETSFSIYNDKFVRVFGDIFLNDGTILNTAPVQSNWNENNISSLAYIQNKPAVLNSIISSQNSNGQINITYTAYQHFFKTENNENSFLITGNKKIRFYNNIVFSDSTEQSTAAVRSDWNETNTNSLAYIQNKPTIPPESSFSSINPVNTSLQTSDGISRFYFTNNGGTTINTCQTINSTTNTPLDLYAYGSLKMRLNQNNYVDILATGFSSTTGTKSYWGYSTTPVANYSGTYTFPISLSTNQGIWIRSNYYITSSDRRIKRDIVELDDQECLNKLLQLKPCKYKYKDTINRGDSSTYGFIAQEVEEVLPIAVKTAENDIPNIYKKAICINGIINIEEDFDEYVPVIGDFIKIYDRNDISTKNKIIEVFNNKSFRIEENEDNKVKTEQVFVYGSYIADFKTLAKECLHPLAISSIQQHNRLIESQKNEIIELKATIATILTRLQDAGI